MTQTIECKYEDDELCGVIIHRSPVRLEYVGPDVLAIQVGKNPAFHVFTGPNGALTLLKLATENGREK